MTFNVGHVSGGTNAGWRRVSQAPEPWECECWDERHPLNEPWALVVHKQNPGYLKNCPGCGATRPKE